MLWEEGAEATAVSAVTARPGERAGIAPESAETPIFIPSPSRLLLLTGKPLLRQQSESGSDSCFNYKVWKVPSAAGLQNAG